MKKYMHLSLVERAQIEILFGKGYSRKEIAGVLDRDVSTIGREFRRKVNGTYVARKAHHKAYIKRKYSKYQGMKIHEDMKLQEYVTKYLRKGWSPEQVAGRIAKDVGLAVVSHTSIYTWLRSVYGRRLEAELRLLKKKRGSKKRLKVLQLEGRVFIDERPKSIDNRAYFGDWEGDFIVSGKGGRGAILVLHERKSRYAILRRVIHKSATAVEHTLLEMIAPLSNFKSLTLDNDIAFVHHEKISKELGVPIFFCHPYASWQKGGVENTNRLIRRFIPKGADISKYSDEDIQKVEWSINSIPRKILEYATAEEVMVENHQMIKSYMQIGRENY
jgi:transposase, IS30 family